MKERGNLEVQFVECLQADQSAHTGTVGSNDGVFIIGNRQDIGVVVRFSITKGTEQTIESYTLGPKSFLTRRLSVPRPLSPVTVKVEVFCIGLGFPEVAAPDGPSDEYPVIDGLNRQEKTPVLLNEDEERTTMYSETWKIFRSEHFTL